MESEVRIGKIRVQILSKEIVRVEYSPKQEFCDEPTFFIPERNFPGYPCEAEESKQSFRIRFGAYRLQIMKKSRGFGGLKLYRSGRCVYRYRHLVNSGELPDLGKTPEVFALRDAPRIRLPEGGYDCPQGDQSPYRIEERAHDLYLLLCRRDAKRLRRLYVELTGRNELVRLSVFGSWNSKYYVYDDASARGLILDYQAHDVPLDHMVIDTDWRAAAERGIGYDVNTKLFPDMRGFMEFAHSQGVELMFNDHPEPVEGAASALDAAEIRYRKKHLQALMELGLDTWWYDRNWSTKLISPCRGLLPETLGLYLFHDITKQYYQKDSGDADVYRRPVIMGNVNNISNGTYLKIADSASHRYSIQWTGDIPSDEGSLSCEIRNLVRAGNNLIPYVNSDCGGHLGNPDRKLFVRWMQFGCFSPVFRPHCTINVERTREPWVYDEEVFTIVREFIRMRYRLLPVIYKNAFETYCTGEPIFKSPGFEYPDDGRAVRSRDHYMLGNDILIHPVSGGGFHPVSGRNYVSPVTATYFQGTECSGAAIAEARYDTLNMVLNHTSPHRGVPVYHFSARFETDLRFDAETELQLRCDDGATVYLDGVKVLEDKTLHSVMPFFLSTVPGGKTVHIRIEYFQAGGEAACILCCRKKTEKRPHRTYLPEGRWMDAFSGRIYQGKRFVSREYALREMPVFIRLGAVLPLAYCAKNTKEQRWDRLVYDIYPDEMAKDRGYLYEDDTETTAYRYGRYRVSPHHLHYDSKRGSVTLVLEKSEGSFSGEKQFPNREIALKYHAVNGMGEIEKVTVNRKVVPFERVAKNPEAFPFESAASAPDHDTLIVQFSQDISRRYTVRFYLKKEKK